MSEFIIESDVLVSYAGNSETVTIPSSVKTIPETAFNEQNTIKTLILPLAIKSLKNVSFRNLSHLEILRCSEGLYKQLCDEMQFKAFLGFCMDSSNLRQDDWAGIAKQINIQKRILQPFVADDDVATLTAYLNASLEINAPIRFEVRDWLLDQARAADKQNVHTWLMDYKNRTKDESAEEKIRNDRETAAVADPCASWVLESDWEWKKLPDKTICITRYKGQERNITIPPKVDAINVTRLGDHAMQNNPAPMSVVLPIGITHIGVAAFKGCENLNHVELPTTLISIGVEAFSGCNSLTRVELLEPGSTVMHTTVPVDGVGRAAFKDCRKLKSVVLPDHMAFIGREAFYDCTGLLEVSLPRQLTTIRKSAFEGCTSLTAVTLPKKTVTVADSAFAGCIRLEKIDIPQSVSDCSSTAFANTQWDTDQGDWLIVNRCLLAYRGNETQLTIPENVTRIRQNAFLRQSALLSVRLPEGVTEIGSYAFAWCEKLREVNFPESLISISSRAFMCCYALKKINVPSTVEHIGIGAFENTGWSFDQGDYIILNGILLRYRGLGYHAEVPEGVTAIGDQAFIASSVGIVTLPQSLTRIGVSAFSMCLYLENISIPEGVTEIGNYAFRRCISLKADSITFPSSLKSVGRCILVGCHAPEKDSSLQAVAALAPRKDLWGRKLSKAVIAFNSPSIRTLYCGPKHDEFEAAVRDAGGVFSVTKSDAVTHILTDGETPPAKKKTDAKKGKAKDTEKEPIIINADEFIAKYLPFYTKPDVED